MLIILRKLLYWLLVGLFWMLIRRWFMGKISLQQLYDQAFLVGQRSKGDT